MSRLPDYAELHCLSNFSFLRGASQPGELMEQARQRGYRHIFDLCLRSLDVAKRNPGADLDRSTGPGVGFASSGLLEGDA